MQVLVIEDHASTLRALKRGLGRAGMAVTATRCGKEGDSRARAAAYDVIILDPGVSGIDGLALLKAWRQSGLATPVLVLNARASTVDKVQALDLGADDYLTKPFEWQELLARLRALVRRGHHGPVLRIFDLEIDMTNRRVRRANRLIRLTPLEFSLLHLLARHPGQVVTRSMILAHLYDAHQESTSNVVDVYIRYLRAKIDKGFEPPLILTCWGQGYLLRGEAS